MSFSGKTAVVTGGGSGIGQATARALSERGARVFLVGRTEKKLKTAARSIGMGTAWAAADLTNLSQTQRLCKKPQSQPAESTFFSTVPGSTAGAVSWTQRKKTGMISSITTSNRST